MNDLHSVFLQNLQDVLEGPLWQRGLVHGFGLYWVIGPESSDCRTDSERREEAPTGTSELSCGSEGVI